MMAAAGVEMIAAIAALRASCGLLRWEGMAEMKPGVGAVRDESKATEIVVDTGGEYAHLSVGEQESLCGVWNHLLSLSGGRGGVSVEGVEAGFRSGDHSLQ